MAECVRVCDGGNLVDFEIMEHPGLVAMLFSERAKLSEAPGKIPRQTMNEVMKIRIVENRKKEESGVGDAERRWRRKWRETMARKNWWGEGGRR